MDINKFINEYKTDIENVIFKELKRVISDNEDIKEEMKGIDEKLNNLITEELLPKHSTEVKNSIKEDILNRITGFTYNIDDSFRYPVRKAITNTINDIFDNKDISNSLGDNVEYVRKEVTDNLINKVNYKINDEINNLSYSAMQEIREHIYNYDDPTGLSLIEGNFINNNIIDVTSTLKSGIRELLTNGTINSNISNQLERNLINNLESAKSSIMNTVHNKVTNGINGVLNKVNINISDILHNTHGTILSGKYTPIYTSGGVVDNNVANNYTTPGFGNAFTNNNSTTSSVTNSSRTNTYRTDNVTSNSTSTDRSTTVFKKSSTNMANDDSVSNIKQDINKSAENKRNQEINAGNTSQSIPNSNVKDATTPSNDDTMPNNNSSEAEDNNAQIDNSNPTEAKTKDDPRRDKCQELVLWEASDRKYVLLRDGTGQHIVMDETGKFIRIQHPTGSYIELDGSGNIIRCPHIQ